MVENFSIEGTSAFSKHSKEAFYHVCTDGSSLDWMFKDNQDFIAGMNRVGFSKLRTDAKVIYFILMDNHIHIILYGSALSCKDFIVDYKTMTGRHIHSRHGLTKHLHNLPTEIIRIDSFERLLETIAYLDRNPLVAGWKHMPYDYQWGLSRFLFRDMQNDAKYQRLDIISPRARRSLLGTHLNLPNDWLIDGNGMIVPTSYADIRFIEKLFATPARYLYFLSKKLEGMIELSFSSGTSTFIQDKDMRVITTRLAEEMFGISDTRTMNFNSRLLLARKLRYDYAASIKQISRMLHMNIEQLKGFV